MGIICCVCFFKNKKVIIYLYYPLLANNPFIVKLSTYLTELIKKLPFFMIFDFNLLAKVKFFSMLHICRNGDRKKDGLIFIQKFTYLQYSVR